MIDTHCHIIPDLDDGPSDMAASLAMGRMAAADGVLAMVSTSHSEEAQSVGREAMEARLAEVREAWAGAGLDIRLELGVEIYLQPDTAERIKAGKLWTMAGSRYVLVELPFHVWPTYAEDALFALQLAGYVPILAHPERYSALYSDLSRMRALSERGIVGQVTTLGLLGDFGPKAKRCADELVKQRLVQLLASDAHSTRQRNPRLSEAAAVAASLVGPEAANALVEGNPALILSNGAIAVEPLPAPPRKGLLGGLFRRD